MTKIERLRAARLDEKNGRHKNAARQFAQLALLFGENYPKRAVIFISWAIRLAPDSPKLQVCLAVISSKLGDAGKARLAIQRFAQLISSRKDRQSYEIFFNEMAEKDPTLKSYFAAMKSRPTYERPADEPLTVMIEKLAKTLGVASVPAFNDETLAKLSSELVQQAGGDERCLLDLSVALMEMELHCLCMKLLKHVRSEHFLDLKRGILGECLMRERNWHELLEHALIWEREGSQASSELESRYELLMAAVWLGDWDRAERASEWIERSHRDYRNTKALLEQVQAMERK